MIQSRKGHLDIVRESLTDLVVAHRRLDSGIQATEFEMYQVLAHNSPLRESHEKTIIDAYAEFNRVSSSVLSIITRVSDATLYNLIQEISAELVGQSRPLSDTPTFETVTARFRENKMDHRALNRKVMDFNQRIEDLMSGAELTDFE